MLWNLSEAGVSTTIIFLNYLGGCYTYFNDAHTDQDREQAKMNSVNGWLQGLVQWIKTLFVSNVRSKNSTEIVEQLHSKDMLSEAKRIDRTTPGSVHTWYVKHQESQAQLIITLDNLAVMRLEMANQSRAKKGKRKPTDESYTTTYSALAWKDKIRRTHRISIQWIVALQNRNVVSRVGTWDADLQGNFPDPNAKAEVIIRQMVREVIDLKPLIGSSWRSRVGTFPWEDILESYARAILGDKHNSHIKKFKIQDAVDD
jgi:ribosomal protein L34E